MVTPAPRIGVPMAAPSSAAGGPTGDHRYDAVVVGGRVAGAATAKLLAAEGLRVLVVDRDGHGTDTLSTHALMRGAVTQLERWGVAPTLRAETPAIERVLFHYRKPAGTDPAVATTELPVTGNGATALLAPRRTLLDRVLVDAAADAGAEVRHRTRVLDVHRHPAGGSAGRVTGLRIADEDGREADVAADVVIGADGLRSTVARLLEVPITRQGREASAYVMRYVEDLDGVPADAYQWLYGDRVGGGVIPTNDGRFAVFAGMTRDRFRTEIRQDPAAGFLTVLHELDPDLAEAVGRATPVGRPRSWPGVPGQFRQAAGPGWALVGDAGYFKDPYAAHGISDALRDAELLATAIAAGGSEADRRRHLADYETTRNRLSGPLFDVLERIASYDWSTDDLPGLHLQLGKAMSVEQKELAAMRASRGLGALVDGVGRAVETRLPVAA
ncbi:MAG: NAD(P)/FAD-dependent oxidoreductase [Actinomycetota bacterium]